MLASLIAPPKGSEEQVFKLDNLFSSDIWGRGGDDSGSHVDTIVLDGASGGGQWQSNLDNVRSQFDDLGYQEHRPGAEEEELLDLLPAQ